MTGRATSLCSVACCSLSPSPAPVAEPVQMWQHRLPWYGATLPDLLALEVKGGSCSHGCSLLPSVPLPSCPCAWLRRPVEQRAAMCRPRQCYMPHPGACSPSCPHSGEHARPVPGSLGAWEPVRAQSWEKDAARGRGAWEIWGEQSQGDVFPSCLTACLHLLASVLLLLESQVGKETLEESCAQRAGGAGRARGEHEAGSAGDSAGDWGKKGGAAGLLPGHVWGGVLAAPSAALALWFGPAGWCSARSGDLSLAMVAGLSFW